MLTHYIVAHAAARLTSYQINCSAVKRPANAVDVLEWQHDRLNIKFLLDPLSKSFRLGLDKDVLVI